MSYNNMYSGYGTYPFPNYSQNFVQQYAPKTNPCDFYAVLNMMWSDYYSSRFDTGTYIELAKDWLNDKDIGSAKLSNIICLLWNNNKPCPHNLPRNRWVIFFENTSN